MIGTDILCKREIPSYDPSTRLAGTPPHVLGMTDLRSTIAPNMDLRHRFGLHAACGSDTVALDMGAQTTQQSTRRKRS